MAGKLFIISAPSGTGKTTILKQVIQQLHNCRFSVSHTTRSARPGEVDGSDYYFTSEQAFRKMIAEGAFLEWALVHGNYYGTAAAPLAEQLDREVDIILDIDVQGADIVRSEKKMPAVYVFIAPPDLDELERRLRKRGTENDESLRRRLENARREIARAGNYDYLIVNQELGQAVLAMSSIIYAERLRDRRSVSGLPAVFAREYIP